MQIIIANRIANYWIWTSSNLCSQLCLFTARRDNYYYDGYHRRRNCNYKCHRIANYNCKSDGTLLSYPGLQVLIVNRVVNYDHNFVCNICTSHCNSELQIGLEFIIKISCKLQLQDILQVWPQTISGKFYPVARRHMLQFLSLHFKNT